MLHWFNPAIWVAFRRMRADRELAADALALTALGERQTQSYGQTLIKLLQGFNQPLAAPALVGILEDRRAMRDRMRMIAGFRRPSRWSSLAGLLVMGLGWVTLTDALPPEASGADAGAATKVRAAASDGAATQGENRLRIVAADSGHPIAGAAVRLQAPDGQSGHAFGPYQTDADGRVTPDLPPQGISRFNLLIRAKGYLARRESIERSELAPELVVKRDPCAAIGGVVRDKQGKPVVGARVRIYGPPQVVRGQLVEDELETVATDAQGRWTCRSLPPNPLELSFKVTHPAFLSAEYDQAVEIGQGYDLTTKNLLAGKAVMALDPGIPVAGSVVDASGQAVAGAEVTLGSGDRHATRRETQTDDRGRFRMVAVETGEAALLVQAPGWAPQQRKFQLARGLAPIEFALTPGQTRRGRVLDEQDRPVAGAVVSVERCQDLDLLKWRTETDAEGRFVWDSAPTQVATLSVSKPGLNRTTLPVGEMAATGFTLRLVRTFLFTGRVLDAETGQPITSFRLVCGPALGGGGEDETFWQPGRDELISSADGTFSVGLDQGLGRQVRFMAVAEGYLPEASPSFGATGRHEYEFKLKKGRGPQGVVVNAAGQPVEGAEVAILGCGYVVLQPRKLSSFKLGAEHITKTDSAGRFSLPPLVPNPRLVAVHPEQGYAETSANELVAAGKIVLLPWGRVEGVMKIGSKVAADQEVALANRLTTPSDLQFGFDAYKTRTDSEGRFIFDKVPPGERQIMRPIPIRHGWSASRLQPLTVKPGEVTAVVFGGTGRPVIGKVVLSDPKRKIDWTSGFHLLRTRWPQPPSNLDLRGPEGLRTWRNSPEYKQASANQRYYAPSWKEDGSFRFDDVAPGRYQLSLDFMEPPDTYPQTPNGSINCEVEVPEIPGGQTDVPLDLGELELQLSPEAELRATR